MIVLGIETSCDECSAAIVKDGKIIMSNVIATQIEEHKVFNGVVPELASRIHTEWINETVTSAVKKAGITLKDIEGVAVTNRPGLLGSLLVGVSFAKSLSFSLNIPFITVDHVLAHLYAPQLEYTIEYPFLGLLVSGGHSLITVMNAPDEVEVLGTTIDDACGEAFDKVAKHYNLGYPGGVMIDKLAAEGNPDAFHFPIPSLHKGDHRYDVSYSGLKTAVINQLDQFRDERYEKSDANIAASFQRTAVKIMVDKIKRAAADTKIKTLVAGGGVAANSLLRSELTSLSHLKVIYPSLKLCTDNGAMIAGLGDYFLSRGEKSDLFATASARVTKFQKKFMQNK